MFSSEDCPYKRKCPINSCRYQGTIRADIPDKALYKNCLIYKIAEKLEI